MLVRFTRPDGNPVLINPDSVEEVMPADDSHAKGAKAVIIEDGIAQAVTESLDEVARRLAAPPADGK